MTDNRFAKHKTMLCYNEKDTEQCTHGAMCIFAHGQGEIRRNPTEHEYCAEMCAYAKDEEHVRTCPDCSFSHNEVERNWHPTRHWTKKCKFGRGCRKVPVCSYAHDDAQLDTGIARRREYMAEAEDTTIATESPTTPKSLPMDRHFMPALAQESSYSEVVRQPQECAPKSLPTVPQSPLHFMQHPTQVPQYPEGVCQPPFQQHLGANGAAWEAYRQPIPPSSYVPPTVNSGGLPSGVRFAEYPGTFGVPQVHSEQIFGSQGAAIMGVLNAQTAEIAGMKVLIERLIARSGHNV